MLLGGSSPPSSWFTGFINKVAIPCPNNPSLDGLAYNAASSRSLVSVTNFGEVSPEPCCSWPADPVGKFSGTALADAGTTCPEDPAFKLHRSGTGSGCPSASIWIKELTFGSVWAQYSRVSCSSVDSRKLFRPFGALFLLNKPICFVFEWDTLLEGGKQLSQFDPICELVCFFGC